MDGMDKNWPAMRYGPGGASAIFESEADVPKGWEDHPSKAKDAVDQSGSGTKTAVVPANTTTTPAKAARTTTATGGNDIEAAAKSGVAGMTAAPAAKPKPAAKASEELDAHGHPYDAALHAATASKTKDGLWRLKVGAKRPEPAPGYPLDL